ncbi:hypothetical protein [Aliikangiella coralliicola]|uniref:Uncharacterized protein n=1 Tax=Aliikangiella coralliicola TaxID=2592383 RepID=A0A545U797_9GAMM|nr:hypothetical protein [Aliikangiella coralliicola]TQV85283.1 hypothetical protein FLL46_19140 [Aliikangiella coralliicola]
MLRFLIKFLLLAIVLTAASVLIAEWKLKKDIDAFARAIQPFVEFDYESANIGLTGEIRLHSITAFVEPLDVNVEIGELRFSAGNLYELAFLESDIRNNKLPENVQLKVRDVLLPFTPLLTRSLQSNAPPASNDILETAYCGDVERIGISEFEAMGFDYLAFSTEFFYLLDKYSGSVVLNGTIDVEDAFKVDYQVNVGGVMAWLESIAQREIGQARQEVVLPDLSLLEIRAQDKGYNQRKAQYCALKQDTTVEDYYAQHPKELEKILNESGIQLSEELKLLYPESIKPESEIYWFFQPKVNFEFAGITYYSYEELLDLSGFRLAINNKSVKQLMSGWSFANYSNIAELVAKEKRRLSIEANNQYETVLVSKSYQTVPLSSAGNYINFPVKLTRDDGHLYEGKLIKTSDKSLWVLIRSAQGEATIPVARNRIIQIEAYKVVL